MAGEQSEPLDSWFSELIRASNSDLDLTDEQVSNVAAIASEAVRSIEDAVEAETIRDVTVTFRIPLDNRLVEFNLDLRGEE